MRTLFIVSIVLAACICSCTGRAKKNNDNNNTPAPLQDNKKSTYSLSTKRGPGDLVEELYDDLKKQTPALLELEKNIEHVREQKHDSAESFEAYDEKNNSYYDAAHHHLGYIHDSLLKLRVSMLITNSIASYHNSTQTNRQLLAMLQTKNTRLSDLYTVLKLVRTLAVMDKYQKDELPATAPLQQVNQEYDKLISETDKLSKN